MGALSRARAASALGGLALLLSLITPVGAKGSTGTAMTADLDGVPIKLSEVANWYCDDFSYPVIHCYRDPSDLEVRTTSVLAVTAVDYVTVYEYPTFSGSYMHMSQDYSSLLFLGWSDRISSLKGRNSESSHFFVDWYYLGTTYSVCCNWQISLLGSFDNTFSSVHRN